MINDNRKFMKGKLINLDKEELSRLYLQNKMSTRKIAKLKECSFTTIKDRLKKFNIPLRKIKHNSLKGKLNFIKELYLNKNLSCPKIGKILSVSGVAIQHFLKKNVVPIRGVGTDNLGKKRIFSKEHIIHMNKDKKGIPRPIEVIEKIRQTIQKNGGRFGEKNSFYGKHHTEETKKIMRLSKKGKKYKGKSSLFKEEQINQIISLYTKELCSASEIGKIFNISPPVIFRILKQNKINTSIKGKPKSEEHKINLSRIRKGKTYKEIFGEEKAKKIKEKLSISHSGIKCHLYKGGLSLGGYNWCEFNNSFRNLIRKRDNQLCMNCGIHREKLRRALNIHHINYDKELNYLENCISLCDKCHSLTNINRTYWTKFFQEKLTKLYDYQYSEKGEIILEVEKCH